MDMAGLRIRPGVEDRDHRPARPFLRRVAHLHGPRAMAERPEIVRSKPARAAQRFGALFLVRHWAPVGEAEAWAAPPSEGPRTMSKPCRARGYRKTRFSTASPLMIPERGRQNVLRCGSETRCRTSRTFSIFGVARRWSDDAADTRRHLLLAHYAIAQSCLRLTATRIQSRCRPH